MPCRHQVLRPRPLAVPYQVGNQVHRLDLSFLDTGSPDSASLDSASLDSVLLDSVWLGIGQQDLIRWDCLQ